MLYGENGLVRRASPRLRLNPRGPAESCVVATVQHDAGNSVGGEDELQLEIELIVTIKTEEGRHFSVPRTARQE